jgi:peptidoglycan/xylan/chitin deacetylase (PgdA/CDA1 family)
MKAISLLYHDVVPPDEFRTSGFASGDADIYKLEVPEFERHLAAIQSTIHRPPVTFSAISDSQTIPLLMTFDDGGSSAHERIADLLEAKGWRGHFFMTTDWIGMPGFLSSPQIRDLVARGHMVGSHSCSHPIRMSHCSRHQLRHEWVDSVSVLSDILGNTVRMASVPGGFYARNVAEAAAEAGLNTLFTSEPRTDIRMVEGCVVLGRYTIQQGIKASTAAAIAAGKTLPRYKQLAYWNAKKLAKAAGGSQWLRMRKWILAR